MLEEVHSKLNLDNIKDSDLIHSDNVQEKIDKQALSMIVFSPEHTGIIFQKRSLTNDQMDVECLVTETRSLIPFRMIFIRVI